MLLKELQLNNIYNFKNAKFDLSTTRTDNEVFINSAVPLVKMATFIGENSSGKTNLSLSVLSFVYYIYGFIWTWSI